MGRSGKRLTQGFVAAVAALTLLAAAVEMTRMYR